MSDTGSSEIVRVSGSDSWDEVPGDLERQPESVVRVTLSRLGGGSRDLFLAPGDGIKEGSGTFKVEVEVFENDD